MTYTIWDCWVLWLYPSSGSLRNTSIATLRKPNMLLCSGEKWETHTLYDVGQLKPKTAVRYRALALVGTGSLSYKSRIYRTAVP
jgi:hypothetical protein